MTRNVLLTFLLCISTILLSGCWDSEELQNLNIVSGVAIDKDGDVENRYRTSVQIINPSQVAGGAQGGQVQSTPVKTVSSSGSTLSESLRKISPMVPGELFFPHIQVMVISEEVAKEGITHLLDVIERDSRFRLLFPIIVAKNNAAQSVLQIATSLDPIPSSQIVSDLKTTEEEWGEYISINADEIIKKSKKGSFTISGIQINGDVEQGNKSENMQQISPTTRLEIGGLALFTDGKLQRWLEGKSARGHTWIMNKMKRTVLNLNYQDMKDAIAIEVHRSNTSVKVSEKDMQPVLTIQVYTEGSITETLLPIDLSDYKTIENLEKQMEKEIKDEIQSTITIAQEEKSDFLELGKYINIQDKKLWKNISKKWEKEVFPRTKVVIDVKAYIRKTGMRTNPQ